MKLFEHQNETRLGYQYYLTNPAKLDTTDRIKYYDSYAKRAIQESEELIRTLNAYRLELFNRFQIVEQANYKLQIEIRREVDSYKGTKKWYYVEINRIYDRKDIKPQNMSRETFEGRERSKAFARFAELKKLYPNTETIQNTDKKFWEK